MAPDLTAHMGMSVLVILWWVAVWVLVEEAILFISGNRRHIKMLVCVLIIFSIVVTCSLFPHHLSRF